MARVKRGVTAHAAHKKIIKQAKGYFDRRKNIFRVAVQAVEKAGQYHIATAAARSAISARCGSSGSMPRPAKLGLTYGRFIYGLGQGRYRGRPQDSGRSRRARAQAFAALVEKAKAAL